MSALHPRYISVLYARALNIMCVPHSDRTCILFPVHNPQSSDTTYYIHSYFEYSESSKSLYPYMFRNHSR